MRKAEVVAVIGLLYALFWAMAADSESMLPVWMMAAGLGTAAAGLIAKRIRGGGA